ncbi:MAG: hypothetical protein ACJAT2_002503 [Bacteriovoracaceae bacterium]|jgi:hypothetical protein
MKRILLCFLFLISVGAQAKGSFFLTVLKKDRTLVSGEFIERYEDRWFYEEDSEKTKKYYLLFEQVKGEAKFHIIQRKDVLRMWSAWTPFSRYEWFLKRNNLGFQNEIIPGADVLTGNTGHHKFEKMFGNFAWDLGVLDESGKQYQNEGSLLEDYYVFDKSVYSPVSGTVVGVVSDQMDNAPDRSMTGDLSKKINNFLTIKMKYPFYLSVVHFKKDSITVDIGDEIKAGQELGLVGNSGVSYIPHLHYTLYIYAESLKRFISVPAFFNY